MDLLFFEKNLRIRFQLFFRGYTLYVRPIQERRDCTHALFYSDFKKRIEHLRRKICFDYKRHIGKQSLY